MIRLKKTSPGTILRIRLEDRIRTCFTLPGDSVQILLKAELGQNAGPFFTFSHFGQRHTCTGTP